MTHSLDLFRFPLRHFFHFVFFAFRLQTQSIWPPFAILNPHIWERSVLNPAVLGKHFLLVTQEFVQLGIADKRGLARLALHGEPASIVPVHLDIWSYRTIDSTESSEVGWLTIVEWCINWNQSASISMISQQYAMCIERGRKVFDWETVESITYYAISETVYCLQQTTRPKGGTYGSHCLLRQP